ncbi:hypothetical protein [Micromonospora sp. NPDC093244]|uniref:hypothetical protein n=1 Tax=Micromonospora sp. NPDC093244 TaxID=3155071 RepID=UPI0034463030
MTMNTTWRVLAPGPSDRVLLAVDFGPGRREAGFGDLVANLAPEPVVWETVFAAQTGDLVAGTDPDRCLNRWLDDVADAGLEVSGVLGYCAGGTLARQAAGLLRTRGLPEPPVVLLDPNDVDGALIQDLFATSVEGYAGLLSDDEIRDALAAAEGFTGTLGPDIGRQSPTALAEAMRGLQAVYDEVVHTVCRMLDADDEVGREFSERFSAFLGYLVTAGRAGAARGGAETVIVSERHDLPAGFGVADHRLRVPRATLLADPTVARLVAEALR